MFLVQKNVKCSETYEKIFIRFLYFENVLILDSNFVENWQKYHHKWKKKWPIFFAPNMHNVLKRMQKQFSDFFRLTKIIILRLWDLILSNEIDHLSQNINRKIQKIVLSWVSEHCATFWTKIHTWILLSGGRRGGWTKVSELGFFFCISLTRKNPGIIYFMYDICI